MKKVCKYCREKKDDSEFIKHNLTNSSICKKCYKDLKENEYKVDSIYKVCDECFYNLPISNFNLSNSSEDGYSNTCKACLKNKNEFNKAVAASYINIKCKKCNEVKYTSEFYRKGSKPFDEACKECVKKETSHKNRKGIKKKCPVCKEEKEASSKYFIININKNGYLNSICKACDNKRRSGYQKKYK